MKIIVAEDDPAMREDIRERLEASGHSVRAVASGAALMQELSRERYELVVTDNNMESVDNGLDALRAIRSRPEWQSISVIVYSSDGAVKNRAEALGAIFIHKRTEGPHALIRAVEQLS